jgi:hypothetical protein
MTGAADAAFADSIIGCILGCKLLQTDDINEKSLSKTKLGYIAELQLNTMLGIIHAVRNALTFALLSVMIVGCGSRDAKMREQIYGTWDGGTITYLPNGTFHFHSELVISNATLKWTSDGTWGVEDGYLITTTTNSTSENTTERPAVGRISRSKITFLDAHNLCYTNERDGFNSHR